MSSSPQGAYHARLGNSGCQLVVGILLLGSLGSLAFWFSPLLDDQRDYEFAGLKQHQLGLYCIGLGIDGKGYPSLGIGWVNEAYLHIRDERISDEVRGMKLHSCRTLPWLPFRTPDGVLIIP